MSDVDITAGGRLLISSGVVLGSSIGLVTLFGIVLGDGDLVGAGTVVIIMSIAIAAAGVAMYLSTAALPISDS